MEREALPQEQAGKPTKKLRFAAVCQKHQLDLAKIAEEACVPEYVVYYMYIRWLVCRPDAVDVIEAVADLTDSDYWLDNVDIVLVGDAPDERLRRWSSILPFHRVCVDDRIIYNGFNWEEADRRFYQALVTAGPKRVVTHMMEAPRIPRLMKPRKRAASHPDGA
jgi:hypothetical protein